MKKNSYLLVMLRKNVITHVTILYETYTERKHKGSSFSRSSSRTKPNKNLNKFKCYTIKPVLKATSE